MNITKLAQPRNRYYQPDRKTTQADIDKFLKARDAFFEVYNAHPVWKDVPPVQWIQGLYGKDSDAHTEMFAENYLDLDPHPTGLHYDCFTFQFLIDRLNEIDDREAQLELF